MMDDKKGYDKMSGANPCNVGPQGIKGQGMGSTQVSGVNHPGMGPTVIGGGMGSLTQEPIQPKVGK